MSQRVSNRLRLFLAVLLPFASCLLQSIFWDALRPFAWSLFYPTVFLSAWLGGLGAGLFSTFVSVILVWFIFIPPQLSFSLNSTSTTISIAVFSFMGILVSMTLGRLRDMMRQVDAVNTTLCMSEERYRMLFNAMDEGFCVIEMLYDHDGTPIDYRFVEINHAFEGQTGLQQAVGKTIREMVPNHDAAWFEIYGKVALTGEAIRFENPANAMNRYYDVFASRIGGEGSRQVGILFKDITERKQGERALITAKEKAELANHAKDSFLATMSHEIRTPLTGLLGMLEVLSLTSLDREQNAVLQAAWDSGKGLLRIVNDILDWSKIEAGKLEIASCPTSIHQLLQEVVNTYSQIASAKNLMILQHIDPRISAFHLVDPLRLSQILNNFVSNAIKFTPNGEVVLGAHLVEQSERGECIRFLVKDSGIGMTKEVQEQLFQRYRQESADTARLYGGTGLGLSICRRLAELMDGKIELESILNQGSVFSFTLYLPVCSTENGTLLEMPYPKVEQSTLEPLFNMGEDVPIILVVDDHPINRDLLSRQLKLFGLRAQVAENGRIALSLWREGHFAMVITDCNMPEMDGYALSRAIRTIEAEQNLPRTPVIAWTANALAEEEVRCQAASMDELLVKPANLTQVREILTKWITVASPAISQFASTDDENNVGTSVPIDFNILNSVVPDSSEQTQVLQQFLSYIRADNLRLIEMLMQGDHISAQREAHRMKGSSRMVGAKQLAKIYELIEQAAENSDIPEAMASSSALNEAIEEFETYLSHIEKSKESS